MADAAPPPDSSRLPWLEPYRAPPRKVSNRRAGLAAVIGVLGLAGITSLLLFSDIPRLLDPPAPPAAQVKLPAPVDLQPQIVLPALERPEPVETDEATPVIARAVPKRPQRRRLRSEPERPAYREVIAQQSAKALPRQPRQTDTMTIAALRAPEPVLPMRPAVNPSARVVRGKTVQLGVYLSPRQAEAAWRSAIRDYTFLVTMPKSIEAVSLRSKRYYRLQLGTPSIVHARQLCGNLRTTGRSCTVA
ncbi:MAG TPA: hypothetical protein VNA29_07875 [Sphingomicrobium sp.]|nr:hypothetical protein [Sphingomicrobium sp.]